MLNIPNLNVSICNYAFKEEQERHDKERKDKEKEERERVQRDVQLHFDESLRLAQKRHMEKTIMNSLSKNSSIGRNTAPPSSRHIVENPPPTEKSKSLDSKERQSGTLESSRIKDQERWYASQLRIEAGHNYTWGAADNRLSVLKREKSPVSPGKVTEANYSPYGYQPFQHTYMAQVQLKASSPNSQAMTDKRTSQRQERPTTPGRQKPIKQSFHHERASPVYQPVVGGGGAFKPYEYPASGPQPAHQNTPSPRYTPSQLDQPQNLVKGEPRPAPTFSPKSAPSPTSATYTHSLIQKGVVPNPLYTSVKDQQYPRATSGSGITSGTPICRPNSVSPQIRQSTYSSAYRSPQPRHSPPSSPHHPPPRISPAPVSPAPDAQPLNLHSIKRKHKDLSTSSSSTPNKIKKNKMEDTLMPPHLQPQYHPANIPLSSSLPYSASPPNSVIHSGANVPSNASEFTPSPSMAEVPSASSPLAAMPTLTNSSELVAMDQVYYSKLDKGRNKLKSVSNHDTPPPTLSQPEEPTPKPAVEHNTISTTYHPKLKKAWLQRHSENEDKKIEVSPPVAKIETPVITKTPPTLEENSSHSLPPAKQEETTPIVNGVDEKTHHEESASSSASEGDRENKSQAKRKIKISSKNWSNKRSRHSETESPSLEETPVIKKEQEEKKKPKESNSRRKRVRKSKNKHSSNDDTNKKKSITVQSPPKALEKPSIAQLKKTGEPFLQDGACYDVAPRLPKCRECRMTPHQRNKKMPNIFCRFYAYRKLKYGKSGAIVNAGFSEPNDASDEDLKLWLPPTKDNVPHNLDIKTSLFILQHVGDYFCNLVLQEKEAVLLSKDKAISWKKVVQGVREQCDVCDTTLFNIHWVCHKCGFVVCIDCYRARKHGTLKAEESLSKDRDEFQWLLCSNRQPHEQDKLMTTQIIAGPSLWLLGQMIHEVRRHWRLPAHCSCVPPPNGINKKLISTVLKCLNSSEKEPVNGVKGGGDEGGYSSESGGSPLSWLAEVALKQQEEDGGLAEEEEALRELVEARAKGVKNLPGLLKHVFFHVIEPKVKSCDDKQLQHFSSLREQPRTWSLEETSKLHPDLNHMWLCDGRLLLLNDSQSEANQPLFQEMWRRGQPVLVANVTAHLTPAIWHPDTFIQDFGEVRNDLVNCKTGAIIPDIPMRKFWEGFEMLSKRLKDDDGEPAVLRLKDWPPGDEFSEVLPSGFKDLMEGLPLRHYILRSGIYNLASRFPDLFARPDLGPRMFISYGLIFLSLYLLFRIIVRMIKVSAVSRANRELSGPGSPSEAVSGLQMDICDSVSVLVYVAKEEREDLGSLLEDAGCDPLASRCLDPGAVGALWHIFHPQDANKIRNFLNKVGEEQGQPPPAHLYGETTWYLNEELRERLRKEEGVECYAVAQCAGDAIFLPAGCPHQVRSLRSCIRVAADFISPENAGLSLQLTQEAPSVLDDKLQVTVLTCVRQIKNLLYHAVKDAVGLLQSSDPDDYFNT
ncbi:KDM3B [Cordylochernes scorpioides]|uniref:KDM3B n=1 Tax=Cordylochernes scorpioides TaxID=51811 RepID=A0ABY6LBT8_9ARAC|nr:KDM3B [Cordylochernes scorpioides]